MSSVLKYEKKSYSLKVNVSDGLNSSFMSY